MVLAVGIALAVAACAGRKAASSACAPVGPEFATGGLVFAECAVDRKAAPPPLIPRIQYTPRVTGSSGCFKAVIDVVADGDGRLVLSTAKVVRSTDAGFTEAVVNSLASLRYTPAQKDGQPVAQLVRVERTRAFQVTVVGAGTTPQRQARTLCQRQ